MKCARCGAEAELVEDPGAGNWARRMKCQPCFEALEEGRKAKGGRVGYEFMVEKYDLTVAEEAVVEEAAEAYVRTRVDRSSRPTADQIVSAVTDNGTRQVQLLNVMLEKVAEDG